MIHEIKNIYSTDQTHYAFFDKYESPNPIILPLIPLNLDYLNEAIARIRKLLIFS